MIYIAGDKHGFSVIENVIEYLTEKGFSFKNLGVKDSKSDTKLETLLPKVAAEMIVDPENIGIVSCGTGVGVEVGINKFKGIRACLANEPKIAKWGKIYDKCNVLCVPGWDITKDVLYSILDAWFANTYDGNVDRLKMFEVFDTWGTTP
ncbi:RpiB/LacA/LacB family sugar-phosphate isomerase [bacterium]|nr:RpiB/LacA/LacB family sugar-phosphate isomerase [bacterium]